MEAETVAARPEKDEQQIPHEKIVRDDSPALLPPDAPQALLPPDAPQALLPLDLAERAVCWRNGQGRARVHVFRRLLAQDWETYFSKITIENDLASQTVDFNSAKVWLYARCILRVEGYRVIGARTLMDLPNWKDRIPFGHRVDAVDLLTSVTRSARELEEIEPECETVLLDALWDGSTAGGGCATPAGQMLSYSGLIHRFTPPSAEHLMRYSRETSRSLIVGGSAKGRTVRTIRQKVLLKFYDQLIVSVEGYGLNGRPLENREAIVREMDAGHKAAAVSQLFSAIGEQQGEQRENGERDEE